MADEAAAGQNETMKGVSFEQRGTVRVGFIGTGGRGRGLLRDLLALDGVQIAALYDFWPENAEAARKQVEEAGQSSPAVYTGTEAGFEDLCRRDDIALVYVASRWEWHVPQAVCAMENGKHVAVEVPAATTLADCWKLVETSEKTRRHCMMLENCCYGYNEMLVRNMVEAGCFGELTHGEAAYIHDLRSVLLEPRSEGLWRRAPHTTHNGNLYPTHGLGPVAQYLGIHRGDRFTHLVSMSSREASLTAYRDRTQAEDSPTRSEKYVCGDMNTSLLRTAKGRTVVLQHDVVTPRPYDRGNLIAGTTGTFRDYPPRVFLDGQKTHDWLPLDSFKAEYEHPLWTRVGELARKLGGHGGMDFLLNYRLIECFHQGTPPDMDVYDAAAWSAPGPLSESSVAEGSMPMTFPDFTRGQWQD